MLRGRMKSHRWRNRLLGGTLFLGFVVLSCALPVAWRLGRNPLSQCGGPLEAGSVPPYLLAGILAQEDHLFFEHGGIDFANIALALLDSLSRHSKPRGASTLAMQVASLCFRDLDKSERLPVWLQFGRKINELLEARALVSHYPREEILRAYLTSVRLIPDSEMSFDQRGFHAASFHYFHRKLTDLSSEEQWRLILTLRNRDLFNPSHLRSLASLAPEDHAILDRAKLRQDWFLEKYRDVLVRFAYVSKKP